MYLDSGANNKKQIILIKIYVKMKNKEKINYKKSLILAIQRIEITIFVLQEILQYIMKLNQNNLLIKNHLIPIYNNISFNNNNINNFNNKYQIKRVVYQIILY